MIKKHIKVFEFVPQPLGDTIFRMRWDYGGWRNLPQNTFMLQRDWTQTLVTKINLIRLEIHKECFSQEQDPRIGKITTSLNTSLLFDDLEYFLYSNYMVESDENGLPYIGSLQGRYRVYRDAYQEPSLIYIGTEEHPKLGCIHIDYPPTF